MLSCILNKRELKVVALSEKSNEEELLGWQIPNVLFPLAVIAFSLLSYLLFTKLFNWTSFFNLLVNGSILMAAFNRMSSMISYASKIELDKNNAKKLGINLRNIKMKIIGYSVFLVLFIAVLYSYQVIHKPFEENGIIFLQFLFSCFFFWGAVDATKIAYLFQEAFLQNSYLLSIELEQQSIKETPEDNDIQF